MNYISHANISMESAVKRVSISNLKALGRVIVKARDRDFNVRCADGTARRSSVFVPRQSVKFSR